MQLSETGTEERGRPVPLIQKPAVVSDLKSISSSSILANYLPKKYEGDSISKLQIVIEKNRMEIMTYKQHLFFNIISIQI